MDGGAGMKGPWHIMVGKEDGHWRAMLDMSMEGTEGPTATGSSMDEAVDKVKDMWRQELQEHFADQDFVIDVRADSAERL